MNSLPPQHRGAGSGMNTTFQNSAQVLSIGIFFTLMIVGLTSSLPGNLLHGLPAHGVPDRRGQPGGPPVPGVDAVRRLPRLRPGPAPDRCPRPGPAHAGPAGRAHRSELLPRADQPAPSGPGCTPPSTSPSWPACWRRGRRGSGVAATSTPRVDEAGTCRRRPARSDPAPRTDSDPADRTGAPERRSGPTHRRGRGVPDDRRPSASRSTVGAPVVLRIGEVAKLHRGDHPDPPLLGGAGPDPPERLPGSGVSGSTRRPTWPGSPASRTCRSCSGFSLAEVRVVLETEDIDVLDRVRSEFRWGDAEPAERRRQLLDEAVDANEKLLARLDDTLARIGAFRDERAAKSVRCRTLGRARRGCRPLSRTTPTPPTAIRTESRPDDQEET